MSSDGISISITEDVTKVEVTEDVTTINITPSVTTVEAKGISIANASAATAVTYQGLSNTLGTGGNVAASLDHINTNGLNKNLAQTITGTMTFNDGVKAIFGTSGDGVEIYHDSDDSYIKDSGTGTLRILSNDLRIMNAAGTEISAQFIQDGEARLKFDNDTKLFTKVGGIDVNGIVQADGLTLDDGDIIYQGGGNWDLKHNTASQNITFSTTPSGGSATERMRIKHDGNVGIGTDDPNRKLHV